MDASEISCLSILLVDITVRPVMFSNKIDFHHAFLDVLASFCHPCRIRNPHLPSTQITMLRSRLWVAGSNLELLITVQAPP